MNIVDVDVLIIGAGPSGAVAASYANKHKLNVKVVEKSKFPRFVIGESLIPRCMDHFEEADLLDCLKAKNFEKKYGARFIKDGIVCLFDFSKKFSEGWDWTWQVQRAEFDKTLTDELINKGIDIEFETEVVDVKFNGSVSTTTIKDKEGNLSGIKAKFVIDASGYGRVLPNILDLNEDSNLPPRGSMFTHVKDVRRPEGEEGTLITFDILDTEVWFWVIPFSNGNTSLGFVASPEYLNSFSGTPKEIFRQLIDTSPNFRDRFKELDLIFEPRKIVGYSAAVKQLYGSGYALTGNSAEFLDPVFSSGVSFATESGILASKLAVREIKGEEVNWEREYSDYIKEGVNVFRTYVEEWYTGNLQKLFFTRPENPEIKSQICAVLAGYVWDKKNPFVKKHNRAVKTLAYLIDMENERKEKASQL